MNYARKGLEYLHGHFEIFYGLVAGGGLNGSNFIDYIHAFDNFAKYGVFAIKEWCSANSAV
jgi:hypothetical protein